MRFVRFSLPLLLLLAAVALLGARLSSGRLLAQEASCGAALEALWTAATEACVGTPTGYFCNGGSAPQAEPAGAVSNALAPMGSLVEVGAVTSVQTAPLDILANSAGVLWLRTMPPMEMTAVAIGAVSVRDVTPPEFPRWVSVVVQTGETAPVCSDAPRSAYIVQQPTGVRAQLAVNGASLGLEGTVVVRTEGTNTLFTALSGRNAVIVYGQEQPLLPGQQIIVPYAAGDFTRPAGAASAPTPYDPNLLRHLPLAILDRPVILPQPGFVATEGEVNMRSSPSTDAGVIVRVPAGEVLSVLGRNTGGDWLHVRLDTGETGWMLAELLRQSIGEISAVYDATPLPPQRFGRLGTTGRVLAAAGVNLRNGPDVAFGVVATVGDGTPVTLLARSPYSPWVKVDASGAVGWVALITLDTKAFIDALPIDYDVPPPPPPTQIPGSFGNAFPDPNLDG